MSNELNALADRPAMTQQQADRLRELVEGEAFAMLVRRYVQRADNRQRAMGLQYTTAETHDLARQIAAFVLAALATLSPENNDDE